MKVQKLTYGEYWGYYWRVTFRHAIPGIFDWDTNLVELIIAQCHPPAAAEILDLGCAGGDQARLLARKGYRVTGIDLVPQLVEYAKNTFRKEGLEGRFELGDILQINYADRFDLCVMLGGTFPTLEEELVALRRIHRALKDGGKAFIDYLPVETYCKMPHSRIWEEIDGGFELAEEWYHVPTSTWRTRHRHILLDGHLIEAADEGGHGANEIIRCYSASEIESLAQNVGFRVLAHLSGKQIGKPDYQPKDDEPRSMVVLEK